MFFIPIYIFFISLLWSLNEGFVIAPTITMPNNNINLYWFDLFISKSTHHPTNKKPHECGA